MSLHTFRVSDVWRFVLVDAKGAASVVVLPGVARSLPPKLYYLHLAVVMTASSTLRESCRLACHVPAKIGAGYLSSDCM